MTSVSEATSAILTHLVTPVYKKMNIQESLGSILGESIMADRDLPPFHRATMDGVAIASAAFNRGIREFKIEGLQAAGMPALTLSHPDNGIEIMTGGVLPNGTDTVIRYEDLTLSDGKAILALDSVPFQFNVHAQGSDAKANDVLLSPGIRISPAEIALMASVGKTQVTVFQFPVVAIVSTGDELVSPEVQPQSHQIRRSNDIALQAALQEMGIASTLFHLVDEKTSMKATLTSILESHSIIVMSGGVSKGKLDFVPAVLKELDIRPVFHQVSQKPGKPFWFGVSANHFVSALPGNPLSTFLCFYRYIKPWIWKCFGLSYETDTAILANDFTFAPPLTYFLQVAVKNINGMKWAYPKAGGGSGDFVNLKEVDGFLELPADRKDFKKGEPLPFIPFRS